MQSANTYLKHDSYKQDEAHTNLVVKGFHHSTQHMTQTDVHTMVLFRVAERV